MGVTIIDVAKAAGVSKSTVSLVVNGNTAIKPETRDKVLKAIDELRYVPNISARNLTTKKTNILGVVMNVENENYSSYEFDSETDIFSYDVSTGIPAGLAGSDYGILTERFCASGDKSRLPKLVLSNRVDGVFVMGGLFHDSFIQNLKKRKVACVVVGRHIPDVDSVSPDFTQAAYLATRYLIDTGHKKILFINCPCIFPSNKDRYTGITKASKECGYPVDSKWTIDTQHNTGEGGYNAFKSCWESGIRPDGIFAANDTIALGVMRYLHERKIRVPDDVSIIGYEDSILAGYAVPPLTTINVAKARMGEESARIMLDRIRNPRQRYVSLTIPPTLVERSTVIRRK
ncbi:LacI family DNA-binding transcriptional regulator [Breznakiella homolactica]|uniref:LacI family DNA-binding transcriptional regulator n=1 Tax=Breznakiella homolactica TaxID=2798577 RepID=A0A7T8BDA0_9SPIR|nr:LacI family DNA-binding transcriptional regulator [Breznakiella homolactica]QQO11028.1 LacI family transcriptional regulator [Breznakiella homolactica]